MNELIKQAQEGLYVRIYGTEAFDLPKVDSRVMSDLGHNEEAAKIVNVVAIGYGLSNDHCVKVPPFYLMVSGIGKPAECNGEKFPGEVKVWTLKKDAISTRLDATTGTYDALLDEGLTEDDYESRGPIDLKVKPSLTIKVKENGNGNICVEYRASVEAFYRVFGGGWNRIARVNVGGTECINDNACIKVIDSDYITGKLCYHPGRNQICLEVKVGYKGAGIKGKACHNL